MEGKRIVKKFFDGSWMLFIPGEGRFYFRSWDAAIFYAFAEPLDVSDPDKFLKKWNEAFPDDSEMV